MGKFITAEETKYGLDECKDFVASELEGRRNINDLIISNGDRKGMLRKSGHSDWGFKLSTKKDNITINRGRSENMKLFFFLKNAGGNKVESSCNNESIALS